MFDPTLRIALVFSLAMHAAVIVPSFLHGAQKEPVTDSSHTICMLIYQPYLASDEETYRERIGEEKSSRDKRPDDPADHTYSNTVIPEEYDRPPGKDSASGPDMPEEKALLSYYNLVREKIRAELCSGRYNDEEGRAEVVFTLSPDGHLLKIDDILSELSAGANRTIESSIRRAQPFPPFPDEIGDSPQKFTLNIRFTPEK